MTAGLELQESVRIAYHALTANRLRAALTTLGIVIGIVTVTLMGTAINGLNAAFRRSISMMGGDVLYVQRFAWFSNEDWRVVRNRRPLTRQHARELERLSTFARNVAVEADASGTVTVGRKRARGVWVMGNTEQSLETRGLSIAHGRWFQPTEIDGGRNVCILGNYLAQRFFPNQSAIGQTVKLNDSPFEVIGVIEPMGTFFTGFNMDNQIIIPVTRLQSDFRGEPDYSLLVKVRDPGQIDDAQEEIRGIMRKLRRIRPGDRDDFHINRQDAFLNFFAAVGGTLASVGLFITGLSLFVGGVGITNIMFVSVAERTREIGIRKAIGARRRTILLQFLIEAAMITLFAGCIGILIAWPITLLIDRFLAAKMSWWLVGLSLVVSVLTGIIAGFVPAWRASRLNPVDALRSE